MEGKLVLSSNRGRYAVNDSTYGPDLTGANSNIEVWLGGQWVPASVAHSSDMYAHEDYSKPLMPSIAGYYLILEGGGICGLCVGMRVRTL